MAKQDWFRNETWSDEISKHFFEKLKRARKKDQYLYIQAYHLNKVEPRVSLSLIDQFFALPERYDDASAYLTRAKAYEELGDVDSAVKAYRDSAKAEMLKPQIRTNAWLEFSLLVAIKKLALHYDEVQTLIEQKWDQAVFAMQHFQQFAALALIAKDRGDSENAVLLAKRALEAAGRSHSGLSRHPTVGLLGGRLPEVRDELEKIVAEGDRATSTGLFQRVLDRLLQAKKRVP